MTFPRWVQKFLEIMSEIVPMPKPTVETLVNAVVCIDETYAWCAGCGLPIIECGYDCSFDTCWIHASGPRSGSHKCLESRRPDFAVTPITRP